MIQILLLASMGLLALHIIVEDVRTTWIPLSSLLAFLGLALLSIWFAPIPGLTPGTALFSAGLGALVGLGARGLAYLRSGTPAFGTADILLLVAGGATLGPMGFALWLLASSLLAVAGAVTLPSLLGQRADPDSDLDATISPFILPFCPALLLGWAGFELAIRLGVITPSFLF